MSTSPRRRTVKKSISLASPRKSILASHVHTQECKHCGKEEDEEIVEVPETVIGNVISIPIEEDDEEIDILQKMKEIIDKELLNYKDKFKIETKK